MLELIIGQKAEFSKTLSEADVYLFAGITADINPIHINEVYAVTSYFGKRIVHGILVLGLVSRVLGNQLPGPGTIYVTQSLNFLAPVFIGDTVTARVEVLEVLKSGTRV